MIPIEVGRHQYRYYAAVVGSWPIRETFRFAGCFYGGIACVTDAITGNNRLINISGETLFEFNESLSCSGFVDGDDYAGQYCVLYDDTNNKFGIVDRDFQLRLLALKNPVSNVHTLGSFIVVQYADGRFEVFNWELNELINPIAIFGLRANRFGHWTIATSRSLDQWRYLDVNSGVLLGPVYDVAYPFENGLAIICQSMKWQLIDCSFRSLFALDMESLEPFSNGFAVGATHQGEYGVLNRNGEFVSLTTYSSIESVKRNGLTIANRDMLESSIDIIRTNGEILASGMDTVSYRDCDFPFFEVTKAGRQLYLDSGAKSLKPDVSCT